MRAKDLLSMFTNLVVIGLVGFAVLRPEGPVGAAVVRQYNESVRRKLVNRDWPTIAAARRVDRGKGPVKFVEFADYECPACRRQHTVYQSALSGPQAIGVVFRHRPLPFHTHAQGAARAAICAEGAGKFVAMHERLFTTDTWLTDTNWVREAVAVGITDTVAFKACLTSEETTARYQADTLIATRLRINSTPTFVGVDFGRVGVMPESLFRAPLR